MFWLQLVNFKMLNGQKIHLKTLFASLAAPMFVDPIDPLSQRMMTLERGVHNFKPKIRQMVNTLGETMNGETTLASQKIELYVFTDKEWGPAVSQCVWHCSLSFVRHDLGHPGARGVHGMHHVVFLLGPVLLMIPCAFDQQCHSSLTHILSKAEGGMQVPYRGSVPKS